MVATPEYTYFVYPSNIYIKQRNAALKTISDPSQVCLKMHLGMEKHFKYWRLNVSILTDLIVKQQLQLNDDFITNDNDDVSSIFWEGAKAALRGKQRIEKQQGYEDSSEQKI